MNCQFEVPSLLQLSAEKVASEVDRYKTMYQYLKRIQLPNVFINYTIYDTIYEYITYATRDFSTYIKKNMEKLEDSKILSVVPTVAKGRANNKLKITVGSEKVLYITTISDLGMNNMLKLDFPEGEYEIFEFNNGYVLKTQDYSMKIEDAVYVFNNENNVKGLAGTYPQGHHMGDDHVRLFNKFIGQYMSMDWYKNDYDGPYRIDINGFQEYVNIPIFFYLTRDLDYEDLSKITLYCPTETNNCGNVIVCWSVRYLNEVIGIAVQQTVLFQMISYNVGICLLASNGHRAIGNFDLRNSLSIYHNITAFKHSQAYKCEFSPCFCDYIREYHY